MKTEKRLTMALSVLVALMMLAVPLASSSNLFVDGGQTNSNGDAPALGADAPSKNDYVEIKDVYVINSVDEYRALPIYKTMVNSYAENSVKDSYPWIVVKYWVDENKVQGASGTDSNKYKLKINIGNGSDAEAYYVGGYSGMNSYMKADGDYYFICSLTQNNGVGDTIKNGSITSGKELKTVYTVTADLYENDTKLTDKSVSMTSEADNVTVEEVWMIDDQNSFEKIAKYGKDLSKFIQNETWEQAGGRDPWVAVAFTTTSPGSVTLNITAAHDLSGVKSFTMYWSEADTYVFVATVSDQDGGTGDKLDMKSDTWDNNIYNIEITAANGNKSVGSVTYGSPSGTYNVVFKLNSDENSLNIPIVKIPAGVKDGVSWSINTDGDLVASVTTEKDKVSIEYLITKIFDQITRNGYTLTEWSSDDGNYTNMSYENTANKYDAVQWVDGDNAVSKNMTFTATWELKEGSVEVPVHVYQDDVLVGDFIKTYDIKEKNTIFVNPVGLAGDITKATGINTYGIIVNGAAKSSVADVREVYSSKVTYGSDNDLPANGTIASNSELTVNYNLNDRLYSKVTVHSEAFKDGKDVTLFALKGDDYSYYNVFVALQQKDDAYDIKAAISISGDLDKDKNAVTSDNYYLLTGWNNGAELLDSSRNAPAELTLDSKLNGYYVIFMVNGQFEVVYVPYGELSADKCTITSGVKYWSYVTYADYKNDDFNKIQTFSFTKSQIDSIEGINKNSKDSSEPIAVFIGSEYSFNNTAYAVFDAGEGNFGNKYVDKMIVSGKASSGTTKTTISLPEVSPVYENTVVLVGYSGYTAGGIDGASTFGPAKYVDKFTANVVGYTYTITFNNGTDAKGIFYYGNVSTMGDNDITSGLVAFSYNGTVYEYDKELVGDALKAFNNILYPAKDGYKIIQWKDADGNVMIDKIKFERDDNGNVSKESYEVKFDKISSDMTFKANFEALSYSIYYVNTYDATATMPPQTAYVDKAIDLYKEAIFVYSGYKLIGWNTSPDGSGTSYALGASFTLTGEQYEDLKNGEFTLYAVWEKVGGSGNEPGNNSDGNNTDTYLLAGILIVIIVLILLIAFLMRRKQ